MSFAVKRYHSPYIFSAIVMIGTNAPILFTLVFLQLYFYSICCNKYDMYSYIFPEFSPSLPPSSHHFTSVLSLHSPPPTHTLPSSLPPHLCLPGVVFMRRGVLSPSLCLSLNLGSMLCRFNCNSTLVSQSGTVCVCVCANDHTNNRRSNWRLIRVS